MNFSRILSASLLALPLCIFSGSALATPVTGQANINGTVTVTNDSILFNPTFVTTPGSTETGSFAGLTGGSIGQLTGGPKTGVVNSPNFMSFNGGVAAPITFDLTYLAPGIGNMADCGSSALGASCTPMGSPFTLTQLTSSTVVASLQVNGNAYIGSAATGYSLATGIFSTQFAVNGTIPAILAQINNGGVVGQSYSASFVANPVSPVPEPASMLLLGAGLISAGVVARRKRNA